jgi:hypothetical protein
VLDVIAGAALGQASLTASGARRVRRSGDRGT